MKIHKIELLLLAIAAIAIAAAGTNSTVLASRAPASETLGKYPKSSGMYDGWVRESTETSGRGGAKNVEDAVLWIGDDRMDRQYLGILHFYTGGLPDNAILLEASLKIKRDYIVGKDPFLTHGNLVADIISGSFGNLTGLELLDFQAAPTRANALTFGPKSEEKWYTAEFRPASLQYINKKGFTQFRLRFSLGDNDDRGADYIRFYSGDYRDGGSRPVLSILYQEP